MANNSLLPVYSSRIQVIVDHDYLGPLCLQFSSMPTVADVKSEITQRTGLPIKDQLLYFNGIKVSNPYNEFLQFLFISSWIPGFYNGI